MFTVVVPDMNGEDRLVYHALSMPVPVVTVVSSIRMLGSRTQPSTANTVFHGCD